MKLKRGLSIAVVLIFVFSSIYSFTAFGINTTKPELRAAWVCTVYNIDWPSREGLTQSQQKSEYIKLLDNLKSYNLNALIFQVRSMGDAVYPSNYAPWSEFLTGTQGGNPGYDPLRFVVDESHLRNMEFHAWFNPFRISASAYFPRQFDNIGFQSIYFL